MAWSLLTGPSLELRVNGRRLVIDDAGDVHMRTGIHPQTHPSQPDVHRLAPGYFGGRLQALNVELTFIR